MLSADERTALATPERLEVGRKGSHYVLIERDYGELDCAERAVVGDWVLYKSTAPYQPWSINSMVY